MKMNQKHLAVAALTVLTIATSAYADEDKAVHASISNPGCRQKSDPIVVPAGKVAYGFRHGALAAGVGCTTGTPFTGIGFSISYDNPSNMKVQDVYNYHERDGVVVEEWQNREVLGDRHTPAVLNALVLGEGKYYIFIGGGDGAVADLYYKLKPGQGTGPLAGGPGGWQSRR